MEQKIFCVKTNYESKFIRFFNRDTEAQLQHISKQESDFKLLKNFEAHGNCKDRMIMGSSSSGPPITIRTPDNVIRIQESVGWGSSKFLQPRSQQLDISVPSARRILFRDLDLCP